jgi:hypothetical protein
MKNLLTALLLLLAFTAGAQDKIFLTTQKKPLVGEVLEVNLSEIKYKPVSRPIPIITIDRNDVVKIEYQSGETQALNSPMEDFKQYPDQHLWNAKYNLFSPLSGYSQFFLEQSVKPGRSREFELNIIGLGVDPEILGSTSNNNNPITYHARGIGLGYGMRFMKQPDFMLGNSRMRHLMQGSYIKPAISMAYYTRNFETQSFNPNTGDQYLQNKGVFSTQVSLSFGRQWILDNTISIDLYGLLGMGYDNVRSSSKQAIRDQQNNPFYSMDDQVPYNAFGATRFSRNDLGVIVGVGIKVGFLFDFKRETKTTVK